MKFLVDSTKRVFLLTGDMGKNVFCNLEDIPKAIKCFDDPDEIKIFHFWNSRPRIASKKMLNEMFKYAGMKFKILPRKS